MSKRPTLTERCAHCSGESMCGAERKSRLAPWGAWVCTLRKGHRGKHLALNATHEVKSAWARRVSGARKDAKGGAR